MESGWNQMEIIPSKANFSNYGGGGEGGTTKN